MKKVMLLLAAGCAIGMLSGCGIPEDQHNAMIADLETKHGKVVEELNVKIADLESVVKAEQAKVRKARIELDDASERITGLQQKSAETSKALAAEKANVSKLESALKAAKSQTAAAKDMAMEAEEKFNTLDVEYQALKVRFENFQQNFGGSPAPAVSAPTAVAPTAEAPSSDSKSAKSLLDEMSSF